MKICTKCKKAKAESEFTKRSASSDGLMYVCRPCVAEISSAYAKNNKEKIREIGRRWALNNPEKVSAKNRRWREKNLNAQSLRARKWQLENPEKDATNKKIWKSSNIEIVKALKRKFYKAHSENIKEKIKKYRANNPDKCRAMYGEKRARKRKAVPIWSEKSQIQTLYAECRRMTLETGVIHHVDHIIPLKHSHVCGLHVLNNLQILTASENLKKHNSFTQQR